MMSCHRKPGLIYLACILLFAIIGSMPAGAANSHTSNATKNSTLRRVDFLVTNTSCAGCIYRLEHRFLDAPGVKKAAIMFMPPYAGSVVYDPRKTSWLKLSNNALKGETAKFKETKERSITKIPRLLIPENKRLSGSVQSELKKYGLFSEKK